MEPSEASAAERLLGEGSQLFNHSNAHVVQTRQHRSQKWQVQGVFGQHVIQFALSHQAGEDLVPSRIRSAKVGQDAESSQVSECPSVNHKQPEKMIVKHLEHVTF